MDELFQTVVPADTNNVDPKSAYEALVGEGKKYASPEMLAASRVHADKFIEKLQSENAELRTELNSRLTVEQLMTKLSDRQAINNDETGNRGNTPQPPVNTSDVNPPNVQLTEEAIARLVQKELTNHSNKTREQANTAVVVSELKKQFGDNYVEHMQARLNELGISKEAAIQLASSMPKAYIELIGKKPNQSVPNQAPPRGFNTASQSHATDPNNPGMSYFNKLRKENPREYFKPHIQNQIMELGAKYGDEFLNR